jgi:hypothetical protein
MPSFPYLALLPAAVLFAVVALAGCGDSGFEGDVDVPDGYATYRANGVSFVHPEAWKPATRELTDGVTEVRFQAPDASGPNAPAVSLTTQDDVGDRFDALLDSQRDLLESAGDATVSQEEVEVPGATKAYRSRIELPGDGSASTSEAVDVLAADGRHIALAAGAPDDESDAVDADAVVSSFRLEGS